MFVFGNEWWMAVSEFGALTREFYIAEIGTWENYGGERVWQFMEGRYNKVLLYKDFKFKYEGIKTAGVTDYTNHNPLSISDGLNIIDQQP